jgi:hypothetical protein
MRHLRVTWIENGRPPIGNVSGQDRINKKAYTQQMTANLLRSQAHQINSGRLPAFNLVASDDPTWNLLERFFSALQDTASNSEASLRSPALRALPSSPGTKFEEKLCKKSNCIGKDKTSIIDGSLTAFKSLEWAEVRAAEDTAGGPPSGQLGPVDP